MNGLDIIHTYFLNNHDISHIFKLLSFGESLENQYAIVYRFFDNRTLAKQSSEELARLGIKSEIVAVKYEDRMWMRL